MFRTCSKIGCSEQAVARVGLDPASQLVIVDDAVELPGGAALLCQAHLDRLSAPRGWWVDDRRTKKLALFASDRTAATKKRRKSTRKDATESHAEIASAPMPDGGDNNSNNESSNEPDRADRADRADRGDDARPDRDRSGSHTPRPSDTSNQSDQGPMLTARTPLLSRAFRAAEASGAAGSGLAALFGGVSVAG